MRILAVVAAVFPSLAFAVVPVDGPAPSSPVITINASPGQQFDPHVSGNLAAYTDNQPISTIRYYDFLTASDQPIPNSLPDGGITLDLLSDVSGSNIVFARQNAGTSRIMVFDVGTATMAEVDPAPAPLRLGAAIGNNTVAYIDFEAGSGDVVTWDLATSTRTVVSASPAFEQNPNVAPNGNVVVWEFCPTSLLSCDIYQAIKTGTSWATSPVSTTADPEGDPDTDGTRIVYSANRAGSATDQDIYFQPVGGGVETQIQLAGVQRNPSISNGVIAFESVATGLVNADLYVYIVATNTLLRITNTDANNETLNDVTVLSNGDVRLVWASNDQDVVATTFTPPGVSTCANRSVVLDASKTYHPTHWYDATANLTPAMQFAVPTELPVVEGNAGNGFATLSFVVPADEDDDDDDHGHGHCNGHHGGGWGHGGGNHDRPVFCFYHGGAWSDHPTSPSQIAAGLKYRLLFCLGVPGVHGGSVVSAKSVRLHVDDGDSHLPRTRVTLTLGEVCPVTGAAPTFGNGLSFDDLPATSSQLAQVETLKIDHQNALSARLIDNVEATVIASPLIDSPLMPAQGCSSSGTSVLALGLVAVAFAMLKQKRRVLVPARVQFRRNRR